MNCFHYQRILEDLTSRKKRLRVLRMCGKQYCWEYYLLIISIKKLEGYIDTIVPTEFITSQIGNYEKI